MPAKASGRNSLLTMRASEQELALLRQRAKDENITMSNLIRVALGMELTTNRLGIPRLRSEA